MNTDALSFLSDELPENWEKVLEREKTIRNQHMIDVENVARRSFETGTISKYTPVRPLMTHFCWTSSNTSKMRSRFSTHAAMHGAGKSSGKDCPKNPMSLTSTLRSYP